MLSMIFLPNWLILIKSFDYACKDCRRHCLFTPHFPQPTSEVPYLQWESPCPNSSIRVSLSDSLPGSFLGTFWELLQLLDRTVGQYLEFNTLGRTLSSWETGISEYPAQFPHPSMRLFRSNITFYRESKEAWLDWVLVVHSTNQSLAFFLFLQLGITSQVKCLLGITSQVKYLHPSPCLCVSFQKNTSLYRQNTVELCSKPRQFNPTACVFSTVLTSSEQQLAESAEAAILVLYNPGAEKFIFSNLVLKTL